MLHSICQQIWKTQQLPQNWKRLVFIPIPKMGNTKECSNDHTAELISHVSKVMLKILQARIQQYMNQELLDIQTGFRRHRGTWDQISSIHWIIEKAIEFNKNIYFCFIDYAKAFDCVDHKKLKNYYRDGSTRPSYMPLEKHVEAVRIRHETMDWFKIGKGVSQGCKLSPYLFNLYAEYIIRNARLDEAQAGVKIAGRNINNLRYAEDNKSNGRKWRGTKEPLDEGERGEWKHWLKTQYQKAKVIASGSITSWQIDREKNENSGRFYLLGLQNHCWWWLQQWY